MSCLLLLTYRFLASGALFSLKVEPLIPQQQVQPYSEALRGFGPSHTCGLSSSVSAAFLVDFLASETKSPLGVQVLVTRPSSYWLSILYTYLCYILDPLLTPGPCIDLTISSPGNWSPARELDQHLVFHEIIDRFLDAKCSPRFPNICPITLPHSPLGTRPLHYVVLIFCLSQVIT